MKINPLSLYNSYKSNTEEINEREFTTYEAGLKKNFDLNYTLQPNSNDVSKIDDSFISPEAKQQKQDAEEMADLKLKFYLMENDLNNILGKLNEPNPNPKSSYYQPEENKTNHPSNVYQSFSFSNGSQNVCLVKFYFNLFYFFSIQNI
jgi:hypothetical protein